MGSRSDEIFRKREFWSVAKKLDREDQDALWTMARSMARNDEKARLRKFAERVAKLPVADKSGEEALEMVLVAFEKYCSTGRTPRDPATRATKLAPGQEWTVALGTINGRVRRADYKRYMKSPEWAAKRQWWWEAAGRPTSCAGCGKPWWLAGGDLHHRSYDRLGYEELRDLVQVCDRCHSVIHANITRWEHLEEMTDLILGQLATKAVTAVPGS